MQAFGFCEYEEPEATLRCIRLLNEWKITDKKLVVSIKMITTVAFANPPSTTIYSSFYSVSLAYSINVIGYEMCVSKSRFARVWSQLKQI